MLSEISGLPVRVEPNMIGTGTVMKCWGSLHVSQEMFDKMTAADPEELKRLLATAKVADPDGAGYTMNRLLPVQFNTNWELR
jgi:hypothetical protein